MICVKTLYQNTPKTLVERAYILGVEYTYKRGRVRDSSNKR